MVTSRGCKRQKLCFRKKKVQMGTFQRLARGTRQAEKSRERERERVEERNQGMGTWVR